ncbi:MAG: Rossmann fold domain-containing protein [Erythrobacter sp.]
MQAELRIDSLDEAPLHAAAEFHRDWLGRARAAIEPPEAQALAIMLPAAGKDHDDWRRAIARDLARAYAPRRVNILGGGNAAAIAAMLAYLRDAPGITGQYLPLHDEGT